MTSYICSESIQARLTGQMDYYNSLDIANYTSPVDGIYVAEKNGTTVYVSEEDYKRQKEREQVIYDWFCNWLNGMDFENMSERERAQQISQLLYEKPYDYEGKYTANLHNEPYQEYYAILIENSGVCRDFAITACGLAKAMGLKSTTFGNIDHMNYFIEVDGIIYLGSNNLFNLITAYENNTIRMSLR